MTGRLRGGPAASMMKRRFVMQNRVRPGAVLRHTRITKIRGGMIRRFANKILRGTRLSVCRPSSYAEEAPDIGRNR